MHATPRNVTREELFEAAVAAVAIAKKRPNGQKLGSSRSWTSSWNRPERTRLG